jgi:hypothetical protein
VVGCGGRRVGRWRLMRKGGRLFRHGTTDIILDFACCIVVGIVVV